MRIAIVGTGAMGAFIARELAHSEPKATLVLVDADLARAEEIANSLKPNATQAMGCDARDTPALAAVFAGADVVVNAAQYDVNLDVMRACIRAKCHYLDLGGMFHMTQRQLKLSDEFKAAGLTAVLGMGAAPGMTNILARHLCDQLDEVESIAISFAVAALDAPQSDIFVPPYSVTTLMQEFCEESVQFIDGAHRLQPPLSGREAIHFPAPIGIVDCVYTLHSEPATLPGAFAAKGVREVTWRLGLPPALEDPIRAFASAGLGSTRPINCGGTEVSPIDFLAASIARTVDEADLPSTEFTEFGCMRIEASGRHRNTTATLVLECMFESRGTSPDVAGVMTGTPCALAALMLARGEALLPGTNGAESVIPPVAMMQSLTERNFIITQTEQVRL